MSSLPVDPPMRPCGCRPIWGRCRQTGEYHVAPERVLSRITVERFLTSDGNDLVRVNSDNMNDGVIPVVEALGLLQLAIYDVSNRPAGESV